MNIGLLQTSTADFHGFVRHDFTVSGLAATVVEPKTSAKGRPWIWRTEFFDHRPMLDEMLLRAGWHVAYLNVGNTFGAPVPMWRFGQFYQALMAPPWNLDRRVVLEGFSRGGLYAYNWALMNPDKVMAIYGDAPVCDFRLWPYRRSPSDWRDLVAAYGFPSERSALSYAFCPIDALEPLAIAKIPIVHVVGDADTVVPVAENTAIVEKRYRALGGTIQVIHKPGGEHHPHSLDDPTPIAKFIFAHMRDSERAPISTTIPTPNLETRSNSAGWQGRSWLDQHRDGARAANVTKGIVMLGDSITQGFGGVERHVSAPGAPALAEVFPIDPPANLGISGDRVQHVLWRVEHGALDRTPAKTVVVMIGINNYPDDSPAAVSVGIERLVGRIRHLRPDLRIVVHGLLGSDANRQTSMGRWVTDVNERLRRSKAAPFWISPEWNISDAGKPRFTRDGVHLTAVGYATFARSIREATERAR